MKKEVFFINERSPAVRPTIKVIHICWVTDWTLQIWSM